MCDVLAVPRKIEDIAISHIDDAEAMRHLVNGRVRLTDFEARVWALELHYLCICQQKGSLRELERNELQASYSVRWQPSANEEDMPENLINQRAKLNYLARRTDRPVWTVKAALRRVSAVCLLREWGGLAPLTPQDATVIEVDFNAYALASAA